MEKEEIKEKKPVDQKRQIKRVMILSGLIIGATALVFVGSYLRTVQRMQEIYTNRAFQDAVELRRVHVEETVSNLITEIDQMRELRLRDETSLVKGLAPAVEAKLAGAGANAAQIKSYFAGDPSLSSLTSIIYEESSGKILADERGIAGETAVWSDDLEQAFMIMERVKGDKLTVVYGITNSSFDKEITSILTERMEAYSGEESTLYWIDRVTTLDNGKVSTVRVFDPDHPNRVGMNVNDAGAGAGPWRFASEGILETGSVDHTDDAEWETESGGKVTAQTYTCAKYYEPYHWAVCGAFRIDAIGLKTVQSQEASRKETIRVGVQMALFFAVVLAVAILLILRNSARYFNIRQSRLKDQVERDALTSANTRAYGIQILTDAFKRFENDRDDSPALMVLDVDKFKNINDTYGHDAGDEALKHIVRTAMRMRRGRDCIIRWGGDEFIAVFYKLERARCETIANKLRKLVADNHIFYEGQEFQVTISVGVTFFKFGDKDYNDALKRADEALYASKEQGRNRICIAE